jgi:hypothetical protein
MMSRSKRPRAYARQKRATPSVSASGPYVTELSAAAKAVYISLHQKMKEAEARGDASSAHHTVFRMIHEAIHTLIPHDPINRKNALSGELSGIFRIRKGRHRICWIASSRTRKIAILFISETLRKDGDTNDPYAIFNRMVRDGEFNELMRKVSQQKTPLALCAPSPNVH